MRSQVVSLHPEQQRAPVSRCTLDVTRLLLSACSHAGQDRRELWERLVRLLLGPFQGFTGCVAFDDDSFGCLAEEI